MEGITFASFPLISSFLDFFLDPSIGITFASFPLILSFPDFFLDPSISHYM